MKHFLAIALLFAGGYCAAQLPPKNLTKQANDSTILAGKTALNGQITTLQSNFAANPSSTASAQSTNDVLSAMRAQMRLAKYKPYLEPNATTAQNLRTAFYSLEASYSKYAKLADNPAKNSAELLKHAKAFHAQL